MNELVMAAEMTIDEQLELAETRRLQRLGAGSRELWREAALASVFAGLVLALWLVAPPHGMHWGEIALCVGVTALAMLVRFDTPLGWLAATQLPFVALAFVVPPAMLPLAVLCAFLLQRGVRLLRDGAPMKKLVYGPSNCFFSLGPAWVLALAGSARHAGALVLVAAFAAQCLADTAGGVLYLSGSRGATARKQLAELGSAWMIDAALSAIGLVVAEQMDHSPFAVLALVPLLGVFAMFARERAGRLDKLLELNETYRGTALLLGDVVEADDGYTGMHSRGVVELAVAVGDALGVEVGRRRDLEFAALLHDVGKIAIPKEIINKPGKLDAGEWELVKTHAAEGERMLARVGGFMTGVGAIVRSHHERWDGGGYPDGLVAEAIPLEARIITACDSWSAMRTDRPYRLAMSHEAAAEEMRRNCGGQFDPRVATALLAVVGEGEASASSAAPVTPAALPVGA